MRSWQWSVAIAAIGSSCTLPEATPLTRDSFAFGVFGDGPYRAWETGRFRRVIDDANAAELAFFVHLGDILWFPCSDEAYADRLNALNAIRHPVVYIPGDNEWADCHEDVAGAFEPLERLERLRSTFFEDPQRSLGGRVMDVESQSEDSVFADFVEHARWRRGGFLFATLHLVGSGNASAPFTQRRAAHDQEVTARTAAALAWLEEAFRLARSDRLRGVVLILHGNPGFERGPRGRTGYGAFMSRLEALVKRFEGPVLLIHGDTHTLRIDHPLLDRETGDPLPNLTRLETYGSPDIGWVRVVVDSVTGRIIEYEPRLMRRWWLW